MRGVIASVVIVLKRLIQRTSRCYKFEYGSSQSWRSPIQLSYKGEKMKRTSTIAITALLFGLAAFGQDGAKQEAKDAGKDAKKAAKSSGKAAKHAGKAVAKGTKKGVNKGAEETEKGADKVKQKTKEPN
jgi:hypothetical protein